VPAFEDVAFAREGAAAAVVPAEIRHYLPCPTPGWERGGCGGRRGR